MKKEIKRFVIYLLAVFLISVFTVRFMVQKTDVIGSSMEPVLSDGNSVLVDKVTYRFREPERFDIVVFQYPRTTDQYYIKRIIGLPGETVQILKGAVFVNGKAIEDSLYVENPGRANEPVILDENEYFVMGDNRNYSWDSRDLDVGNIDGTQILGRAILRIWPFSEMEVLEHRQVANDENIKG